jgi:NAD-dependent deacetylase sirtuin 5
MAPASSSVPEFQAALAAARRVTVLTGAGISAESGVPTFRGAGGLWRRWSATDLATPGAWARDPGLVWEFYDYRRRLIRNVRPNPGHAALAALEARWAEAGGDVRLVTQNIDGLHALAGSDAITRLHGSLWHVRCLGCGEVTPNRDVPITAAFAGAGSPDPDARVRRFEVDELPHCERCGDVLRPHVVWFGEGLDPADLDAGIEAATSCDLLLVVGTSALVTPAASLIPLAREHGARVAEVNLEATPASSTCDFVFRAKSGELLPELLDVALAI